MGGVGVVDQMEEGRSEDMTIFTILYQELTLHTLTRFRTYDHRPSSDILYNLLT